MTLDMDQSIHEKYKHYYWGIPDSPIDWCENNYQISPYICEFYNTFSSFAISFFALYGVFLLTYPFGGKLQQHVKILKSLEIRGRTLLAYAALSTVGVGSAFYHATLLYKHQLFDEFPMVISVSLFVYCILTIRPISKQDSPKYRLFRHLLPWVLSLYVCVVAGTIFVIRDVPTILQVSFGALVFILITISQQTIKTVEEPLFKSNPKRLLLYSTISMVTAYFSWLIERKLCSDGGYVIPGLQLHAIWHVLTGLSGFYWMQFYLCLYLEKLNYKTQIIWSWFGVGSIIANIKSSSPNLNNQNNQNNNNNNNNLNNINTN
ncbi:alkaline dihydroceramidase [Cavenderia fasciculata]|uniref:Alkaline dihydroceramidase n=1 Tax=Cavenderia fasciculata TaxID=261658 RepID=F4PK39_CACFS|nr:alkaline dihydroceramidase [Cavenderia fasciculata]EGG23963.1 alkaline dihydroceramidase [Cavenderia fasciculata]|eukprot:XP_004361814.1 alkaline dihydroceramidase [Cavenderia fasciculata]